ncbi:MAG: hypothetical protein JWO36_1933 [Myxococcales bacterium]|nr:hypothetical protein [Myxococcales bacterium]
MIASLLLAASPALAEGERALSVGLGWATFSAPGKKTGNMAPPALSPDVGGALSVIYERAIGTDFALRGELSGGLFYGGVANAMQSKTSYAGLGDVGAVFRFDVLKYVPYAFVGIGGLVSGGGPIERGAQVVLAIGGGVDFLQSRSRSWGFEGRLASFGGDVTILTFGVRGTVRWGYF